MKKRGQPEGTVVYGINAVRAALANRRRTCLSLRLSRPDVLGVPLAAGLSVRIVADPAAGLLPPDAVHQGAVGLFSPLQALNEEALYAPGAASGPALMLDGVTDPRNVGAVLRSCAAFGIAHLILQDRKSPDLNTPALLKTACGGGEQVAVVRVVNLSRTLRALHDNGALCVGLAAEARDSLGALPLPPHTVFVVGSEGDGMRRLVRESCDVSARIPVLPGTGGLNAASAAALALYEYRRQHPLRACP